MTTRRTLLTLLGSFPLGSFGAAMRAGELGRGALPLAGQDIPIPSAVDEMDEALEMLSAYGPSFRGGLSNHGPMAAEALIALGRKDVVIDWVASYRRRLEAQPASKQKIAGAEWRAALGDRTRNGDWEAFFRAALAEAPWREVLAGWVPRLAPGIAAAGLHGVIRAGHAVCSLERKANELRLDELARGLAYWASEYLALPGRFAGGGKLSPSAAFKQVQQLPPERRSGQGLITSELRALLAFEPFADVIQLVDPGAGSPSFLDELLAGLSALYINTESSSFVFLHGITGTSAMATLLPYVPEAQRPGVQAYTWQIAAGILARYGQPGLTAEAAPASKAIDPELLARRAVSSGDEHSIKLIATCLREWRRSSNPCHLAAARERL